MTLKYISKECKCCESVIQVPTNNEHVKCHVCGSSNCKNPDAYITDEDRFLDAVRKADMRYETEW